MLKLTEVPQNDTNPLRRVGVLGAGLVGGSVALAARRAGCDVVVYDSDPETCEAARAADFDVADTPAAAVRDRDVIFLCVPVDAFSVIAPMFRGALSPDCIVTDVSSVKRPVRALQGLLGTARNPVILGHPMAGSHRSGFTAASEQLFDGCTWLLCDAHDSPDSQRLTSLLRRLGAQRVLDCPVDTHDTLTAVISHLPQVTASALAATVGEAAETLAGGALEIAGGGFRDTTRIAESPFSTWKPILKENGPMVSMLLRALVEKLEAAADALHTGESEALEGMFEAANSCRDQWKKTQPSADFPGSADVGDLCDRWVDPASGEEAWVDRTFGWETVRSTVDDPEGHARISARYLAAIYGVDPDRAGTVTSGISNAEKVAVALCAAGIETDHVSTWTADGMHVEGVRFGDRRFVVIT